MVVGVEVQDKVFGLQATTDVFKDVNFLSNVWRYMYTASGIQVLCV